MTVVLIRQSDTITYFCTIVGIFWAGYTAFPISPRNGTQAVADLLSRTKAECLLISPDARISHLANAALDIFRGKHGTTVSIHDLPTFDVLFDVPVPAGIMARPVQRDIDQPLMILHSSGLHTDILRQNMLLILSLTGSTAFPKPISWSARRLKQWALLPCAFTLVANPIARH